MDSSSARHHRGLKALAAGVLLMDLIGRTDVYSTVDRTTKALCDSVFSIFFLLVVAKQKKKILQIHRETFVEFKFTKTNNKKH